MQTGTSEVRQGVDHVSGGNRDGPRLATRTGCNQSHDDIYSASSIASGGRPQLIRILLPSLADRNLTIAS